MKDERKIKNLRSICLIIMVIITSFAFFTTKTESEIAIAYSFNTLIGAIMLICDKKLKEFSFIRVLLVAICFANVAVRIF